MREYHIVIGSKSFFNDYINKLHLENPQSFLALVRLDDSLKNQKLYTRDDIITDCLVVRNDDYHGIVSSAHDRLGELIKDLTQDDASIYIHNPPATLKSELKTQSERSEITLEYSIEKYDIKRKPEDFVENINSIEKRIFGQHSAVAEMAKSIWYLTNVERKKPYVVMLYGKSSLGKTELVREIANCFYDSKFMEKHLSMFKSGNYAEYFFGNEPNRSSLGFELLERESNLIFLDELDKCPEGFYSAFYTLFDNVVFKDLTYEVDISGTLIVLTSNYDSEDEMKKNLGLPIFYRIDKFIHFEDFNTETIYQLVKNEISNRKDEFADFFTEKELYEIVSPLIQAKGENARTIKIKIQQAIENMMFTKVENSQNGGD